MATGSGKTKVISLALAWSFFHKLYEPESELARNFLVITPNLHFLKTHPVFLCSHGRNQQSTEFPIAGRFAHGKGKFVSLAFCLQ